MQDTLEFDLSEIKSGQYNNQGIEPSLSYIPEMTEKSSNKNSRVN